MKEGGVGRVVGGYSDVNMYIGVGGGVRVRVWEEGKEQKWYSKENL